MHQKASTVVNSQPRSSALAETCPAGFLQFWFYISGSIFWRACHNPDNTTGKYHKSDSKVVKYLVFAILLCDTAQQGLLCHAGVLFGKPLTYPPSKFLSVYAYLGIPLFSLLDWLNNTSTVTSIGNPAILLSVVKLVTHIGDSLF
jgi:hypothetical protein